MKSNKFAEYTKEERVQDILDLLDTTPTETDALRVGLMKMARKEIGLLYDRMITK